MMVRECKSKALNEFIKNRQEQTITKRLQMTHGEIKKAKELHTRNNCNKDRSSKDGSETIIYSPL